MQLQSEDEGGFVEGRSKGCVRVEMIGVGTVNLMFVQLLTVAN